jgi:hypothetical protein
VLLESVARIVEGEPTMVFDDPDVRQSAQRLSTLLHHRMTEDDGPPEQPPSQGRYRIVMRYRPSS